MQPFIQKMFDIEKKDASLADQLRQENFNLQNEIFDLQDELLALEKEYEEIKEEDIWIFKTISNLKHVFLYFVGVILYCHSNLSV